MKTLRLILMLGLLAGFSAGCARLQSFQSQFDKKFAYGPLMRLATDPSENMPDFNWADLASEMAGNVGAAGSTGAPACPT